MNNSTDNRSDRFIDFSGGFWPLLTFDVLSVFCSIILLILLLSDRNLRSALHNHLIILLLLVNLVSQLIDNPTYLSFLHYHRVWPATSGMCIVWILAAYQFFTTSTLIVALASVQRHILIFYQRQCLSTSKRQFFSHYLPIALLLVYSFGYGFVLTVLLIKDDYPFDYSGRICGGLAEWILDYPILSIFDTIVNGLLPTPIIIVASFSLIVRVVRQKKRLLGRIEWKKQRKLTIQLLSISSLFIVINLPSILIFILKQLLDEKYLVGLREVFVWYGHLSFYQSVVLPFTCLIPLWKKAKSFCLKLIKNHIVEVTSSCRRRTARVTPMN